MTTIKEIRPIVDAHTAALTRIVPLVDNHQLVLYGDPEDRKDEGILGAINNIEQLVVDIRSWVKPIALSIVSAAVFFAINQMLGIYVLLNTPK